MKHISELIGTATVIQPEPIKTGFRFLDETIGGYYPGELTTLCGFEYCLRERSYIHRQNYIHAYQPVFYY